MRARNIKPGFFTNDQLGACEPLARLLFVGLWCIADSAGRLEYRAQKMKVSLLPYDDVKIEALMEQLALQKLINIYEVGGKQYVEIPNFVKHQNPHHKEPKSVLPKAELKLDSSLTQACFNESASCALIPDSGFLNPDSGFLKNKAPLRGVVEPKAKEPSPPKTPAFDPLTVDLPAALDIPSFRPSWTEWVQYRRNHRMSTREDVVRKQLELLASFGADGAVAAINASIAGGWRGLFPPRNGTRAPRVNHVEEYVRKLRGEA